MTPHSAAPAALCTEAEITRLVHDFYAEIRRDEELGPIFDAHIDDWDHHLARMVDFWSSVLLRTGRYAGTPMPKHIALPGLSAELFRRWLDLFHQTTADLGNDAMAEQADEAAERIARSLWFGYQMSHDRQSIASSL